MLLVGGTVLVLVLVVLATRRTEGPREQTVTDAAPASSADATSIPAAPLPPSGAQTAAAPVASIERTDAGDFFLMPDGALVPVPPGFSASTPFADAAPPELPQTPEWKLEKTERILELVTERADRLEKEISAMEKAGSTDLAQKRVLLTRLRGQIASMKKEIQGYKDQIAADGGTMDAKP